VAARRRKLARIAMVGIHQHVLSENMQSQPMAAQAAQVSLSSPGSHQMMPMYFTWSIEAGPLLFPWWQTSAEQPWLYYFTLLVVFCLGMLQEWLHFKRVALSADAADLHPTSESAPLVSADRRAAPHPAAKCALYAASATLGFMLMLLVMAYNAGIFLAGSRLRTRTARPTPRPRTPAPPPQLSAGSPWGTCSSLRRAQGVRSGLQATAKPRYATRPERTTRSDGAARGCARVAALRSRRSTTRVDARRRRASCICGCCAHTSLVRGDDAGSVRLRTSDNNTAHRRGTLLLLACPRRIIIIMQ
jgi:hypothetical protein